MTRTRSSEDQDVAISGTAINAHLSPEDTWFTHPFGNDQNFDIAPDPEYVELLSPIQKADIDAQGRIFKAELYTA